MTASNESTLTEIGRSSRASRFYEGDEVGTLAQVVSKYVCIDTGKAGSSFGTQLSDSSKCLLSTQVPYSEDSSTSSVSPSADTATSPDSASGLPTSGDSEMVFCKPSMFSQNPDNLQSILPSSVNGYESQYSMNTQMQGDWPINMTRLRSLEVPASWSGVTCEPSESWSNLCELPAAWQYYTDPGLVANDMEVELVDVKRELAMRNMSCEAASSAAAPWQSFQDDGCDGCFSSADWRFPVHCDAGSSISCLSDTGSDEYLCCDMYAGKGVHDQLFPVLMEEPTGYDILGVM